MSNHPKNVVLVCVDTLATEYISNKKYTQHMPTIMDLLKDSVHFTNAYSVSPSTIPSLVSVFSSMLPINHKIRDISMPVDTSLPLLQTTLKKNGYHNAGFVSVEFLGKPYKFNHDFHHYASTSWRDSLVYYLHKIGYKRANLGSLISVLRLNKFYRKHFRFSDETNKDLEKWFSKPMPDKFFLFLHYFDLHRRYDGMEAGLQKTDRAVKFVIDSLKEKNLYEDTLIVLFADHGEEYSKKLGRYIHGFTVRQPVLNVPLAFHAPKYFKPTKNNTKISLLDVAPTITDCLGITKNMYWKGKSLFPGFSGTKLEDEIIVAEVPPNAGDIISIQDTNWKYTRENQKDYLYNLKKDPKEETNVFEKHKEDVAELTFQLKEMYSITTERFEASSYTKAALDELGYNKD